MVSKTGVGKRNATSEMLQNGEMAYSILFMRPTSVNCISRP
jgi:hypothetical protein